MSYAERGVSRAASAFPAVPACFGWLSLDRRGDWRLKGGRISHSGLLGFINRNYGPDGKGNWIFRNGPQAVFVDLEYTPLIYRFELGGTLVDHMGRPQGTPSAAYLDEEGNVLLRLQAGIGLLDDRELAAFLADFRELIEPAAGNTLPTPGTPGKLAGTWRGLLVRTIRRADVSSMFGFNPNPTAGQPER